MARDGQGLEVSNADAVAIGALDFLRDEWLGFGNRLGEFVATAETAESCALLPLMAASLMLSMNSTEGQAMAEHHLARARTLSKDGADANDRERAWLTVVSAWLAGVPAGISGNEVAPWLVAFRIVAIAAFSSGALSMSFLLDGFGGTAREFDLFPRAS